MADLTPRDILWFETPDELRDWLDLHHETAPDAWIGMRPKGSVPPTVSWNEIVEEVLCVGWVDSVRKPVPGGSAIRITPRRARSVWSLRNVGIAERLIVEGRMRPAGAAAFARRTADRTGIYSYDGDWVLDAEAEATLRADPSAWAFWEAQPKSYRRLGTKWVMSAKRPDTRQRRLARLVDACAAGERLAVLTGGARPASNG